MEEVAGLCMALQVHFGIWNLSRIKCLAQMVLALTLVKTINLVEVANAFHGSAKRSSHYKRVCRFMTEFTLPFDTVAQFIVSVFPFGKRWYIAIDRTNWKLGKQHINVFMLSICYNGIAVPLLWKTLHKCANTKTADRIEMLDRFMALFGVKRIISLLGDREFVGKDWLAYLVRNTIPYTQRIKCSFLIPNSRGTLRPAKNFFRDIAIGQSRCLGKRMVTGSMTYIVGKRLADGEYQILITDSQPEQALHRYTFRQEIETLFGCLKTRGYNFEDTHITEPERLDNLIAVLAITFAWHYRAGDIFNAVEPIEIKSHGDRAKSIFRHGYDYMRALIINLNDRVDEFFESLSIIITGKLSQWKLKPLMTS